MYKIKDWDAVFENADTRKRQRLGWFLVPSGNDSAGYIELMSHGERGLKAYGVFLAICQWSATCLPPVRGTCARSDGRPMTIRQIAAVIRIDEKEVTGALELLADQDVGWIEFEDVEKQRGKQQSASHLPVAADNLPPHADDLPVACQSPASHLPQGEGKGEGKGEGEVGSAKRTKKNVGDNPPTVEEVRQYMNFKNYPDEAEAFVNHYTANGWVQGRGKPLKDWKAAVANWQRNDFSRASDKKTLAERNAAVLSKFQD